MMRYPCAPRSCTARSSPRCPIWIVVAFMRASYARMNATTIQIGQRGEDLAVQLLGAHGYRIIERNFRCKAGELDLVAWDGQVLVFVEVRSRATARYGHAAEMVTVAKRRQ